MNRACLVVALLMSAFAASACQVDAPSSADTGAYPALVVEGDGVVRFDLGAGSLQTVNDEPWGGRSTLVFPPSVDSDAGPVEVEILGLDLSTIDYRGGLGWPSDTVDAGALINVGLYGTTTITYRIFSMVDGLLEDGGYPDTASVGLRAYAFHGYDGPAGPYGMHNLGLEAWGPEGERGPYNTFDVRLRLDQNVVSAWVRLHASLQWETEGGAAANPCPRNVAINNAAPGTVDSVWSGECRAPQPGQAGRPAGAWVPVQGGPWSVSSGPDNVQFGIAVSNWEHARGLYQITWDNVVLRGPYDDRTSWSLGGGYAPAFDAGQGEIDIRGGPAEVRYVASTGPGAPPGAVLEYRAPGIELRGEATHGVLIDDQEASISGTARVNGVSGHPYEFTAVAGSGDAPGRFVLQVWDLYPPGRMLHTAFGSLAYGAFTMWPGAPNPDSAQVDSPSSP